MGLKTTMWSREGDEANLLVIWLKRLEEMDVDVDDWNQGSAQAFCRVEYVVCISCNIHDELAFIRSTCP